MKRNVNDIWEVDERHDDSKAIQIGCYTVIQNLDEGVIISGGREVNLFQLPIEKVSIGFFEIDSITRFIDEPSDVTTIYDVYEFNKGQIYYTVSYCDNEWVFEKSEDAGKMSSIIFSVKAHGLEEALKDKLSEV
jgi:hypothetical protein